VQHSEQPSKDEAVHLPQIDSADAKGAKPRHARSRSKMPRLNVEPNTSKLEERFNCHPSG
jgi:hypothetical protein